MPIISSKAQNRWAHWAAKHAKGKTRKAARQAVSEFHGRTTKNLPERKTKKSRSRRKTRS